MRARRTVLVAWLLIGVIALGDWYVPIDVAFGFLYLLPIAVLGTVWSRWSIGLVAALCTALENQFDPYSFPLEVAVPHDIVMFSALAGAGFVAHAVTRSRRLATEAEEQFAFFVNTSPAAIVTMTNEGEILLANAAADRLFRASPGTLPGTDIRGHIPALAQIPSRAGKGKTIQSAISVGGCETRGRRFWQRCSFPRTKRRVGRAWQR